MRILAGLIIATWCGLALAQDAPAPAPRTYAIDAKRSMLVLQVFKDGAASAFAHDHTVHATELAGEIVADAAAPESARVSVTVQTKSLVNDDAQVRRTFGLEPTVPEKDKKEVEKSMKGPEQLDVARFPTITFKSTGVEKHGDKLMLVGDFTLHGVTKPLRMPVTVTVKDGEIVGDGKVRFKQSDHGITPYTAFLGAVKNKDEVVLNVHLVGVAK
jgi:polyisoprenoid-binding protein YceI